MSAHGVIHRQAGAVAEWHSFEEENVVVVVTGYKQDLISATHSSSLSIEAAVKLYNELGDILRETMWSDAEYEEPPF